MIKLLVSLYFYDDLITGYLTVPLWRLEPYAVKVARTVLRRAALGNECHLSDKDVPTGYVTGACNTKLPHSVLTLIALFLIGVLFELLFLIAEIPKNY